MREGIAYAGGHAMTSETQVLVAAYETRVIHTVMQLIPTWAVDIS
jgi:hypothetical protein